MRPGRVVCFTLSLLICCGESGGGGADGGTTETAGGIGSGTVDTWVGTARGVIGGALVDGKAIQGRATFGDPRAVDVTFRWAFRRAN